MTYPIPGNVFDSSGDFLAPDGSISAAGLDNDINAGGNRAYQDVINVSGTNWARFGAAQGGGGNMIVALSNGVNNLIVSDPASATKTIHGGNRIAGGMEFFEADHGTVSSTTISTGWNDAEVLRATIGASVIFNFWAPDVVYHYTKTLLVTQDGTGGRVPTFHRHSATSQIQWTTPEPGWASMAAGEVWRVTAQYLHYWLYLSAVKVQS